ncbi:DNA repair protein [Nodosilinea sp. LEGE 07298]|uniref:LexA family protein n=1 Tax=Nodosilinea sp. LEGE 07298 TaxID=2777970 RepID=UPI00187E2764|nr:S24 family peptidase [Nodosilinea sp. LEGE 07298]MBE9111342.1 DNA repair protein [Nodosilinea sp. LEGE 07298]
MAFPIPGDAIEQSLDLNQHLIHNPAATFFMRVEGDMVADQEVQPGDLLVVDRSQTAQDGSLVVAAIAGSLQVLRLQKHHGKLVPAIGWELGQTLDIEVWGVVTTLIRKI